MIASKLQYGDEIRVVAPSMSLSEVWSNVRQHAIDFWDKENFHLSYSARSHELDKYHSSSITSRVSDLHEAFLDPNVKMIISCLGGFNANQILPYLDYELIANHPKIICGYSDITALLNAIYARTGLITYHGPHFSTFGFNKDNEYTKNALFKCIKDKKPFAVSPSQNTDKYHIIQEGTCEGIIIGGNLCTLNLLQGTPYMPNIRSKILFLEDDNIMGQYFSYEFERNLVSLLQSEGAESVKGIILGKFDKSCGMTLERVADIVCGKVPPNIPVVFGVDFGHVFPIITFPIGGTAQITANREKVIINVIEH